MISSMIRILLTLSAAALILLPAAAIASEPLVLGDGVTVGDTVPVKALLIDPERYVGKTVVVDGVVTAIEPGDGSRIRISDAEGGRGVTLVLPTAGFRLPDDAVGRRILTEGEFNRVEPNPGKVGYVIRCTGAVLR